MCTSTAWPDIALVQQKHGGGGTTPAHLHNMDEDEIMQLIAKLGLSCKALS